MAVAGPSKLALRAVAAARCTGAAVAVTLLGRPLFEPRPGVAVGVLFALLTSSPVIEANLALTELFAAMPIAVAFCLMLGDTSPRRARALLSGGLLAVACL